jgi:hypothetical protein
MYSNELVGLRRKKTGCHTLQFVGHPALEKLCL